MSKHVTDWFFGVTKFPEKFMVHMNTFTFKVPIVKVKKSDMEYLKCYKEYY